MEQEPLTPQPEAPAPEAVVEAPEPKVRKAKEAVPAAPATTEPPVPEGVTRVIHENGIIVDTF